MAFDQQKYINEYIRESYDHINISVPKGERQNVKQFAESRGLTISQFVAIAIREKMEREGATNPMRGLAPRGKKPPNP